jgi:iron complex transport system substrate-binding protein
MSATRVVSLLPSATEIVAALGYADALVGRSHECDFPDEVVDLPVCTAPKVSGELPSEEIHRSVSALLAESLSVYRVDTRVLRELSPTHVVTQVQCDVCAVSLRQVESALSEWDGGKPALVALSPSSLADVFGDIERVAAALGAHARGARLIAGLRGRMDAIASVARGLSTRPRVATIEWLSPLMTAGNWMPELIAMAGGEDLLGRAGAHSRWIGWDEVCSADPDVLLVFPCGFALERVEREIGLITQRPGWSRLRAVAAGRVYLAEFNQFFNRPGPRLVETLEIVAEVLHPEAFAFGHEGKGWVRLESPPPSP